MKKLIILSILISSQAFSIRSRFRSDLQEKLQTAVCDKNFTEIDPVTFWKLGIFDSQITGQVFKIPKKINNKVLEKASIKLAEKKHKLGAAAGFCEDGSVWTIATPAPENIISYGEKLSIHTRELNDNCSSYRVDFAADGLSLPKKLAGSSKKVDSDIIFINTKFLKSGVISLSCDPKDEYLGPQTWFMIPNKEPKFELPNERFLQLANDPSTFVSWLNSVRTIYSMKPLRESSKVNIASKRLVYPSINHNRKILNKVKKALKKDKIRLIGENRFIGKDIREAAKQFWMSPRHRSLLLNKNANEISVIKKATKNGNLIVLTVASSTSI